MQKEIKQTWFFNQTPEAVWEYLTQPELMEQWLMKSDFKPVVGHKFSFMHIPKNESNYKGIVHGEVLEITPFTRLSYSWNGNEKDGKRGFNSIVVWILVPKEGGTELQLIHDGFTLLEDVTAHTTGWNSCITKLERLLNMIK
jgi:uncharacterized protein YndB with AHSA1/START domain